MPSADTLPAGSASLGYSAAIPGAVRPNGHAMVAGFGLTPSVELSGRLVTQSVHCNLFDTGACPDGIIRDLSASFKWSPLKTSVLGTPLRFAVGGIDVGGAANQSNTYYGVATADGSTWSLSAGTAWARAAGSPLNGAFIHGTWAPIKPVQLTLQQMGRQTWASVGVQNGRPNPDDVKVQLAFHQRVTGESDTASTPGVPTPRTWWSLTLTTPLTTSQIKKTGTGAEAVSMLPIVTYPVSAWEAEMKSLGFHRATMQEDEAEGLILRGENTAYYWNTLDALGVMAKLASQIDLPKSKRMVLVVTQRGIDVLAMRSTSACLREWITSGRLCESTSVQSALSENINLPSASWMFSAGRPDIIISPVINSTIGTEIGALDYHIGLLINAHLSLWRGASLDWARLQPTSLKSDDFKDGYFRNLALSASDQRRMLHQVVNIPWAQSQARMSYGSLNDGWRGTQIETQSQTKSGRDRVTLAWGLFKNPQYFRSNHKEYASVNYRHAWDESHKQTTSVFFGEFWGGDRGLQITHRFWFGDANVGIFFRESSFGGGSPKASFAGMGITIPLTPRRTDGFSWVGLRGSPQFSYGVETRIRNATNDIGGGYGIFPNIGESLVQSSNRDRSGSEYFNTQLWRARQAAGQW